MVRLGAPSGIVKGSNSLGGVLVNHMLTALGTPYLVAATGVFSQITVFFRSSWYAPADTLHAFAAADLLAMVFMKSDDLAGLRLASECIRISCLSLPFHSVVYLFNNYLMAAKKLHFSSIYSFLIECGVMVPVTFFMIAVFGYRGAWIAKAASMLVLTVIAVVYVSLHKGPTFADKMLLLPESFGITRENEIAMIASSTKDLEDLSRIAVAFAMEHGADEKRALKYGLITEELSVVLAEHGFSDGKPHHIHARLVWKDKDLIVRI